MSRLQARAIALALMGTGLAACGGDKPSPAKIDSPEITTTTVVASPTSEGTATSSTVAGGSTTTTRRGSVTTVATPTTVKSAPGSAFTAPSAGRYSYTTTGSSTLGTTVTPFPGVTTLVVDPATGTTQHSIRNLKDVNGMGASTDYVLDYRADGVYLVKALVNVTSGALTNDTPLNPATPVMFIPTGATVGTHLEVDLPGTGTGTATTRLVIDVLREEAVSVGGQSVNAIVVRGVVTLPPGAVSGTQDLTLWFDRQSRLVVKESSRTDASALGGLARFTSNYEATIQSLSPA